MIIMFMGEYHHSIDDKNRLTMPSKLRGTLGETFIITRGIDTCLFIYPKDEWNNIITKYRELPNTKDARNFMRIFLSGACEVSLDKQGRINITEPLVKYANLLKQCVIIGVSERLEVWSEENWNNFMNDSSINISNIAEELFNSNLRI